MNISRFLWDAAANSQRGLPVLSFPAARKLGVDIEQLVKTAGLQARAMEVIAR